MGVRTGNPKGRPKGSPNKASVARQAEVEATGLTPLAFMLSLLRDEGRSDAERFEAAKHAAPYVHPKLSSVQAEVEANVNAKVSAVEWTVVDPPAKGA